MAWSGIPASTHAATIAALRSRSFRTALSEVVSVSGTAWSSRVFSSASILAFEAAMAFAQPSDGRFCAHLGEDGV